MHVRQRTCENSGIAPAARPIATAQSVRGLVTLKLQHGRVLHLIPNGYDIKLEGEELGKQIDSKAEKDRPISCPVYYDGESVSGQVTIRVREGSVQRTTGSNSSLWETSVQTFDFMFKNVEKQYESYLGTNVKLRIVVMNVVLDVVKERDIWVHSFRMPPDSNNSIKMEVGIEDCLYIEFGYDKSKYHLKDVIVGKIYFLLVRIKIKHMELSTILRETTGSPPNQYNESETITKFEIMDSAYPILFLLLRYSLHREITMTTPHFDQSEATIVLCTWSTRPGPSPLRNPLRLSSLHRSESILSSYTASPMSR
ncbi:vacuolar protein sorting-associated protein 26-domain-containing protein [Lactarius hengduanensis]|nr:vacuolar protein sorting-associated protein 26-domain-containing protein [Lactarius hengduanensis]